MPVMPVMFVCSECKKKYKAGTLIHKCECGGMLDIDDFDILLSDNDIIKHERSLFRYIKALPVDTDTNIWKGISMGEGFSPIVPLDKNSPNILVKLDYLMPTMSFKDRGAVILVTKAKELGVNKVIQDSSGNAGASVAAYAKRAGIECDIYVPEGTSLKKINQIFSYGANVHIVKGNREDTAEAALYAVEKGEGFYASHVYNPFFYQGTKTYVYEIFEQLNGSMPDILVIPVGNGTLLLGTYYGLRDLVAAGQLTKIPKIIAVQSENCAPIYKSFVEGKHHIDGIDTSDTLAEGIAIANPKRGKQILEAIRDTNGFVITSPEEKIVEMKELLAHKGFYVEPTTAATFAGYFKYVEERNNSTDEKILIPLCGSGLKSEH